MRKSRVRLFLMGVMALAALSACGERARERTRPAVAQEPKGELKVATFAGGCFWCMEPPFEKLRGVEEVVSGYTGGTGKDPTSETYAQKGHVEAVRITYDPCEINYDQLLKVYWHQIDPSDPKGQFVDRGQQYRSVIFYHNKGQKKLATQSKKDLQATDRFRKKIVTEIVPASEFYLAEDNHQDYYKEKPLRYKYYRSRSGRDEFFKRLWGADRKVKGLEKKVDKYTKPSKEKLKEKLTPIQYKVTQKDGTEPAFKNKYWDNKREGIYVDVVSGEPLFASAHKFKSGTGWPSFTRPLEPDNIVTQKDRSLFRTRTEVRSKHADSHLGHVFEDGPEPTGLRYCMNSAALRFIPRDDLKEEGYGGYRKLFDEEEE